MRENNLLRRRVFLRITLVMTTVSKTPTLRQLAASIVHSGVKSPKRTAYPYARALQEIGIAERGRPGRGGTRRAPASIEHGQILALAATRASA